MATAIKLTRTFSNDLMTRFRQQGDPAADAVIAAVAASPVADARPSAVVGMLMRWLGDTSDFDTTNQPSEVQAFFATNSQLPNWADPAKMAQGMAFFQKHAGTIGLILGTFSLPYCYLAADGAQVLWQTERIKNDTARRLQETGEWVFAIMNPKAWASGQAVSHTLKVRLIHAAVRWFTLQSGRWNMDWGFPVNQEDMAGTNGAFSYIVIRGLRQAGISTSEADEEAYLHHVNVAGAINGVAAHLLPQNLREAYHLDRIISKRQFGVSEAGQGLTKALLNAIGQQAGQGGGVDVDTARNLAAGEMRFFMGDTYADMLGVPPAPLEKRLVGLVNRLPIFPNTPFQTAR